MSGDERVDHRVHHGARARLVADSPAEVEDEGQAALLREPGGVLHRVPHAPARRDAAARVVRDLQPEQLGPRRDALEAGHVEQVVPSGDPGDVCPVRVIVEHDRERRDAVHLAKIRRQGDRFRAQRDGLSALAVVVQRHLVFERAIEVRVEKRHPPVRGLHDDHGEDVRVVPVAVQIGVGHLPEGTLTQAADVPGRRAREPPDATGAGQRPAPDHDRAVTGGGHRSELDRALPGEVPHVEQLGRSRTGRDQPVYAGVDAGVEDADQDAATVIRRMLAPKLFDARAAERHQSDEQRARRRENRHAAGHTAVVGRCGGRRGSRGRRGGWRGGRAGDRGRTAARPRSGGAARGREGDEQ